MGQSVIGDWIFATALGAEGREIGAFLDVGDDLRRAEFRERGLAECLLALEGLGRWARIFRIGELCRIVHERGATAQRQIAKRILLGLIEDEESTLRASLERAIRDFAAGVETRELLRALQDAAVRWLETENPALFSNRVDYSDIEVFAAPSVIIALWSALAQDDGALGGQSGDRSSLTALDLLLRAALEGRYGRHLFLLALDISLQWPDLVEPAVIEECVTLAPRANPLEGADMLPRLIRWRFLGNADEDRRAKIAMLAEELALHSEFGRLFAVIDAQDCYAILWNQAIWHAMLDVDPGGALSFLSQVWIPRIQIDHQRAVVRIPEAKIPAALAIKLGDRAKGIEGSARTFEFVADLNGAFGDFHWLLSPWPNETPSWKDRPLAERLRWLCGLDLDTRILETQPFEPRSARFALHLLSSIPQLRAYRNGPTIRTDGQGRPQFDLADQIGRLNIGWLARHALICGTHALSGEGLTTIDQVVDLIHEACASPSDFAGVDPGQAQSGQWDELKRKLTTAGLRLVETGLATGDHAAGGGWLGVAGEIADLHESRVKDRSADTEDPTLQRVIARFVVGRPESEVVDTDAVAALRRAESAKPADKATMITGLARRLLVAPTHDASLWIDPVDVPANRPAKALTGGIGFAKCLMRVAAAARSGDAELAGKWRADLEEALCRITRPIDLDRFARLKLIELIQAGALGTDPNLLSTATRVLIVFGGPFEIRRLIRVIAQSDLTVAGDRSAREAIFAALTRPLADQARPNLAHPKRIMLEQLKATCLIAGRPDQLEAAEYLLGHARAQRASAHSEEDSFNSHPAALTIDIEGRLHAEFVKDDEWVSDATAEMIAVDASAGLGVLVHIPPPPGGALNEFGVGPGQQNRAVSRQLGVVEQCDPVESGGRALQVRVSPSRRVTIPYAGADDWEAGELVIVGSGHAQDDDTQIGPPLFALETTASRSGTLFVSFQPRPNGLARITLPAGKGITSNWTKRTSNFAILTRKAFDSYSIRLTGTADEPLNAREPATLGFADLLVEHALRISQGLPLVFALHDVVLLRDTLTGLILEDLPLRRYFVSSDIALAPGTANAIAEEIARLRAQSREPDGLLISLVVLASGFGPQLALATGEIEEPGEGYSGLVAPFDERNLAWRDRFLFGGAELAESPDEDARAAPIVVQANRDVQHYSAELPAGPNFPSMLSIVPDSRSRVETIFVALDAATWNPWEAAIDGTIVEASILNIGDTRQARREAIEALHGLAPGDALTLTNLARRVLDDGRVVGFTDMNLQVRVNAETITTEVFSNPKEKWDRKRRVILSQFAWRRLNAVVEMTVEDVPIEAMRGDRAVGYLISSPIGASGTVPCEIAWIRADGEGTVERKRMLDLKLRTTRPAMAGSRVEADLRGGRIIAHLSEPQAIADAAWEPVMLNPDDPPPQEGYFGSLYYSGTPSDLYELVPGRFAIHPTSTLLSTREALMRFFALHDDHLTVRDRPYRHYHGARSSTGRRCALDLGAKGTAAGMTRSDLITGWAHVTAVRISLKPVPSHDGHLLIERTFNMEAELRAESLAPVAAQTETVPAGGALQEMDPDKPVTGKFDRKAGVLRPQGELRHLFPAGIEIAPNCIQRAPLRAHEFYPEDQSVCRMISVDPPRGSFIDTEPSNIEQLAARLSGSRQGAGHLLDRSDIRLIFVGRREMEAGQNGTVKTRYLFEWGYGSWIALFPEEILYQGQPIETAKFQLFFGDSIIAAEVTQGKNGAVLAIHQIAPSQATLTYKYGKAPYRVVNLLTVRRSSEGLPVIDSIQGFDPRLEKGHGEYSVPHARLDPDTAALLSERLAEKNTQVLLARLDTRRFADSDGEEMIFTRVRLDTSGGPGGLRQGERAFVAAGDIVPMDGDVALPIRDPGLHDDDVDMTFRTDPVPMVRTHTEPRSKARRYQRILRRFFSLRERTLGDILALDGADAFRNDLLLVALSPDQNSLIDGSIPRNPEVVDYQLRDGVELLATFGGAGVDEDGRLRFELQPGVVVGLDRARIEGAETLFIGDVVRLELRESGMLRVELASPSDLRFVGAGRPSVLLPRNTLRRRTALPPFIGEDGRPDPGLRKRALSAFSVGDLPDLTPRAKELGAGGRLEDLSDPTLEALMSRPHPKAAWLAPASTVRPDLGTFFLPELPDGVFCARLKLEAAKGGAAPLVRAFSTGGGAQKSFPTDWYHISFRDVPATEIERLAVRSAWTYHDATTIVWARDGGWVEFFRPIVPPASAGQGPIFLELLANGAASARYGLDRLRQYAVGPAALVQASIGPSSDRMEVRVVVAGPNDGGLFVEISPGRLAELPGGITRHARPGHSIPLATLDWRVFGPGDKMVVKLTGRASALAPIEFDIDWTHGPRNAFGPEGAVLALDVARSSAPRGFGQYGTGAVQVSVPSQDMAGLPLVAIIGGEEHVAPLPTDLAALVNRTVLLVEQGDGRLLVHGIPNVRVRPFTSWNWQNDPMMRNLIHQREGGLEFGLGGLISLIRLAGGALPFTVEGVGVERDFLSLSRRHQLLHPAEGRMVKALVTGFMEGSGAVQLRVGARHFCIPDHALVSGMPPARCASAVSALRDSHHPVWLRFRAAETQVGYGVVHAGSFSVAPLCVVGEGEEFHGMVCEGLRDGKLYWLAAPHAAACRLTFQDAEAVFRSGCVERLEVVVLPNGAVSVVHHPTAMAELARLQLGVSTGADCLPGTHISRRFWKDEDVRRDWNEVLVQSKQTSLIFAYAAAGDLELQPSVRAQVAVRQEDAGQVRILLVSSGTRRPISAAPPWLFGQGKVPWAEDIGARYLRLSRAVDDDPDLVPRLVNPENAIDEDALLGAAAAYLNSELASLLLGLALISGCERSSHTGSSQALGKVRMALMRDIYARSLRSLPFEHFATSLILEPGVSLFTQIRYRRMCGALVRETLEESQAAAWRWLNELAIEPAPPGESALAGAFGAILGQLEHYETLVREAHVLPGVIRATRFARTATNPSPEIIRNSTRKLREIVGDLIDRRLDIPLARSAQFARD